MRQGISGLTPCHSFIWSSVPRASINPESQAARWKSGVFLQSIYKRIFVHEKPSVQPPPLPKKRRNRQRC
ncbi:hypothetical protein HanIR_Chr01g0010231 [Helianthus annuus]|nr:hypothetical protein HanIR_Chr01g0010231 [Helianthus annuus]